MMKIGEFVVIVDSVEEAVKFYTEKLGFDVIELQENQNDPRTLAYSHVCKSKCGIIFRKPFVEEFAEFSFIKRCMSRCVGMTIEMNNGIESFFDRCQKKGVDVVHPLERQDQTKLSFTIKDPFGIKLVFVQPIDGKIKQPDFDFHGYQIKKEDLENFAQNEDVLVDKMTEQLKTFGILRRAAKKYAKLKIKNLLKLKS